VLGVARATLSNLINGRAGISPEMAIRLAKAFGGSPETWLELQRQCDLAQALKRSCSQGPARDPSGGLSEPA
jgi:antitoxin HigA-1